MTGPEALRKFNGWQIWLWLALIPIAAVTGLLWNVAFVSVLSIVALVLSSLSAWEGSRVEVVQDEDADVQEVLDAVRELMVLLRNEEDS